MTADLKFRNRKVISSHTLLGIWLDIYTGIEVNSCVKKGSLTAMFYDDQKVVFSVLNEK